MTVTVAKRLLSRTEAAEYLGLSRSTLDDLAARGRGPRRIKFGDSPQSTVKYDRADLDAYIDAHRVA